MYFKQKRIWITGASSGIGEALCKALAAQGAHLIISARNERELQRVAAVDGLVLCSRFIFEACDSQLVMQNAHCCDWSLSVLICRWVY